MKNAPTKKVENNLESGLKVELDNGVLLCANYIESYPYETIDIFGNAVLEYTPEHYTITSHCGYMPAFCTQVFDTIQDLANVMQSYCSLRKWRIIKE